MYRFALWLGWRYRITARHGLRALMSRVATIGVALSVALIIVGLSVINGFETAFIRRVLDTIPHGEITACSGLLQGWSQLVDKIATVPGVVATTPYLRITALIERAPQFKVIQLRGVEVALEAHVTQLVQSITLSSGAPLFTARDQIVLSSILAQELALQPGEWITLLLPTPGTLSDLRQPRMRRLRLKVTALLHSTNPLQEKLALMSLSALQEYLGVGTQVSGIALRVDDLYQIDPLLQHIRQRLQLPLEFHSWMEQYGPFYRDIQMVRVMVYLALLFVMGIACFNITMTLVIAVQERRKDIAVLQTLGAEKQCIGTIFICYGFWVGVVSCGIGCTLGLLTVYALPVFGDILARCCNVSLLPHAVYFIDFIPTEVRLNEVVYICLSALVLTLLASLYPAYRVAQQAPGLVLNRT